MKLRQVMYTVGAVLCVSAMALAGGAWDWTARGADFDWKDCDNWDEPAGNQKECYPSTTGDDVRFPNSGPWEVGLVTETIDDLKIIEDVDFGAYEATPTLTVDSLKIVGGSSGVTVRMNMGGPWPYIGGSIVAN